MRFANPELLWLLLVLLPMIGYYVYRTLQGGSAVTISTIRGVENAPRSVKYYLRHLPFVFRCAAVALIIVALARPQNSENNSNSTTEGIDIVMSLDISGSMLARDFEPDRMTAAKDVAAKFINDRPNDRIGLVAFAGESFTQSPLTTDKASLLTLLAQLRDGIVEDGTAIGNGLATAVNRLKDSQAKSKVVILLTDGVNNSGQVAPLTAAEIAQSYGVRVYTIGVGSMGKAPYPAMDVWGNISFVPMDVEIDEEILTKIADQTGGEYFRATDKNALIAVYDKINALERTKVEVNNFTRYNDLFALYLLLGLGLLAIEFLAKFLWLRQIP